MAKFRDTYELLVTATGLPWNRYAQSIDVSFTIMHVISEKRAVAHWQVLMSRPLKYVERFHKRFLEEQLPLAQALANCVLDLQPSRRQAASLTGANTFTEVAVADVTSFASIIAEIIRREAGRALRQVTEEEVNRRFKILFDTVDRISNRGTSAGPAYAINAMTEVRQAALLRGATVAYSKSSGVLIRNDFLIAGWFRLVVEALDAVAEEPATDAEQAAFWSVDRIEEALSVQGDPMRHAALAVAEAWRTELIPRLLAELEAWVANPGAALDEDGSLGMHALFLLAKWREPTAWPVMRRLFSLPEETPHNLMGDADTERGGVLLASVVGGRHEELRAMFEDEAVDPFCRQAVLEAMACRLAWGESPRAELVGYLRQLLTGRLHVLESHDIWAGVIELVCDLEAWELRPEMEAAFARGLADASVVDTDYFAEVQTREAGSLWAEFTQKHAPIRDVAEETYRLDEPLERRNREEQIDLPPLTGTPGLDFGPMSMPLLAPPKVGRNDPCPCGSGKKFKKCCGR